MKKLTRRQQEILDFIKQYIREQNFPPTIREVAQNFSISVKGGYDHIKALERKEYIKYNLYRSRTIKVLTGCRAEETDTKRVPILGSVAAGSPLFAEENFEGEFEVPVSMTGRGKHFAVRIKGDSMKDAGILDGDLAVIHHQDSADNGDIVVAMVEDAVALKRIFLEKNRIKLKSENSAYPPIYTQDVRILGRLACLIRKYD